MAFHGSRIHLLRPAFFRMKERKARPDKLCRPVGAPAVHKQDLTLVTQWLELILEGFDGFRLVVDGDDDGNGAGSCQVFSGGRPL